MLLRLHLFFIDLHDYARREQALEDLDDSLNLQVLLGQIDLVLAGRCISGWPGRLVAVHQLRDELLRSHVKP